MIALATTAVPIPDPIAARIGACIPIDVLQAEVDADSALREVNRFRFPLDHDDRHDRERALSQLHLANKTLAAHNPRLVVKAAAR